MILHDKVSFSLIAKLKLRPSQSTKEKKERISQSLCVPLDCIRRITSRDFMTKC